MSNIIHFNDISKNNYSLSAKLYENPEVKYENSAKLSEFLICPIQKGSEVGSDAYIHDKKFQFIRTANIHKNSILFDEKSAVGIPEKFFENHDLKMNQILIVKDGSLGNVAFLDKDYPSFMLSSGINALSCKHPFYVFSILQHDSFKKNFEYNVASGSTISHAKDIYLNFDIPLPKNNDENVIKFIENIMKSMIVKERLIKEKINSLNDFISSLLNFNNFDNLKNIYPTYSDLVSIKRLDSGYYTKKSIYIRNLIESYENGYFLLNPQNLKGGNTPKIRSEPSQDNLEYKWIIPSHINEFGLNIEPYSINFKGKNNLNKNACLIINRTSKKLDGQSGKYVGISSFYDYSLFGKGHHNQGFYRIENYDENDLITFVVLLNHPIYREYFGEISIGSKMKEIKKYNLIEIPFPKFNIEIKQKIKNMYYNKQEWDFLNSKTDSFEEYDKIWSEKAGIFDLYIMLNKQKNVLDKCVEKLYENKNIEINYMF